MKSLFKALTLTTILAIGSTAIVAVPSAEAKTCATHRKNTANRGTAYGAVGGALLGNAVAGRGNKTEGTVLGGVVGAVAGHQIAKSRAKCANKRMYRHTYYKNGQRHYYYSSKR